MELSGERSFISGASLNISATWNGPASEICRTYWLKSQKGSLGAGWVPRQRTSLRNSELIDSHKRLIICTWIYGGVKILPKYLIYLWRLTWWSTRSSRTFPAVSTLMSEWTQKSFGKWRIFDWLHTVTFPQMRAKVPLNSRFPEGLWTCNILFSPFKWHE